jgi:hypothetical protein
MIGNKKAQMTIIGLILVAIMVIVLSYLMPVIIQAISSGKNTSGISTSTSMLMDLIPGMFVLGIIITIFIYAMPYRPTQ